MTTEPATEIEVFYSYSHKDEDLRNELEKQLSSLKHEGLITGWHDRKIGAGMEWEHEIDTHLDRADIILLLVSADFLASGYCYDIEVKRALERHETGETRVIPIILRPADWQETPFGKLQALPKNARPIIGWRNRDQAFLDVAIGIRKAVKELRSKNSATPSLSDDITAMRSKKETTLPHILNLPHQRNPFYTGRERILKHLHDTFGEDKASGLTQPPQVISGLGGIGKTQTAVEYAYRYHGDYSIVLWANADSHKSLVSEFGIIAKLLNLFGKDAQDQSLAAQAVMNWLKTHSNWLLILNNSDNLKVVKDFIPTPGKGCVLLTTRAQAMGRMGRRVEIEKMESEEGALFLLRRANIIAPDAQLTTVPTTILAEAEEIVQVLDGLPLALDQAGAYIEETGCSLSVYLSLCQTRSGRVILLNQRGGLVSDHPEPIATTWSLSFQRVRRANPAAADLLLFCAFLHPDAIPEEIFTEGIPELGPVLQPIASDSIKLNAAIGELLKYSLIHRNPTTQTLNIHRLVQMVLKDGMDDDMQHQWAVRIVRTVNHVFPTSSEFATWEQCQRLLLHAQVCAVLIDQWNMEFSEATRLLNEVGHYLCERVLYTEAEPLLKQAYMIRERVLGSEHPDVAQSLNALAELYYDEGKYDLAEPLSFRSLSIRERVLGPEHLDVAQSLNTLAELYRAQGKYAEAEPLYERALMIRENALGLEHADTANSLNNLALLYDVQGRYAEAEQFYLWVQQIYEKVLEPEHPYKAVVLNNLALRYHDQGKYSQAELFYQQALTIAKKTLGSEHTYVASILNNLAELYRAQGKYSQAKSHFQQALTIYEKILGIEHSSVASTLNNLALLYDIQGKYAEAELHYQRALSIDENILGPWHPGVAADLNNLAGLYRTQGKYVQAEPLYQRAFAIYEKALGSEHPNVAIVLENHANLLRKTNREVEATKLEERAHSIRTRQ